MTTATGGSMRWERNQNARCLPPVWKRAIEYAAAVPTRRASTVVENATMIEFSRPVQPLKLLSACPKCDVVGCAGNHTGGWARRSSCGLNAVTTAQ